MIAFVYRCPATSQKVQGHVADDLFHSDSYEAATCTACGRVHLVNAKTGKVLEPAKSNIMNIETEEPILAYEVSDEVLESVW